MHPSPQGLIARLAARSQPAPAPYGLPTPCLIWGGATTKIGYGKISAAGKTASVHRLAWQIRHGPIPEGMHVLHHCDVRTCWADDHLYLGNQSRNIDDAVRRERHTNAQRRRCPAGHAYDKENTYLNKRGGRICRACNRDRARANYARRLTR